MAIYEGAIGRDGYPLRVKADPFVAEDCRRLKNRNENHNFDSLGLAVGSSGTGKSTFILTTIAPLICKNVNMIYVTWNTDDAVDIMRDPKTEDESFIYIDESENDLSSGKHASAPFKRFSACLSECRFKRFYIFLSLPSFFVLSKNLALFRSNLLYRTKEKDNRRGYVDAWGYDSKKYLYIKGGKYLNENAQTPDYKGNFLLNKSLLNEVCPDYEKKKKNHFHRKAEDGKAPGGGAREDRANYILDNVVLNLKIMDKKYWTHKKIADFCKISERVVKTSFKRLKDNGIVPSNLIDHSNWYNKYKEYSENILKNTLRPPQVQSAAAHTTLYTGDNGDNDEKGGEGSKIVPDSPRTT